LSSSVTFAASGSPSTPVRKRIACEERTELPVSDRRIKRITGVVLTDGASTSLQQGHDQLATLPLLLEAGWLEKRVLPLPGRNGIIGYREYDLSTKSDGTSPRPAKVGRGRSNSIGRTGITYYFLIVVT
jgi:hypothetical protein